VAVQKLMLGPSRAPFDDVTAPIPHGAPVSAHRARPLLFPLLLLLTVLAFEEDGSLTGFTWQRPIEPESYQSRPAVILFGDSVDRFAVLDYCAAPAPPGRRRFLCNEGISKNVATYVPQFVNSGEGADCERFDAAVTARRSAGGPCLHLALCVEIDDAGQLLMGQPTLLTFVLFVFNPFGANDIRRNRVGLVPGLPMFESYDANKSAAALCCASEATKALNLRSHVEAVASAAVTLLAAVNPASIPTSTHYSLPAPAVILNGLFWDITAAMENDMRPEFVNSIPASASVSDYAPPAGVKAWAEEWAALSYSPGVVPLLEHARDAFEVSFGKRPWVAWRTANRFGPTRGPPHNAFVIAGTKVAVEAACTGGFPVVDFGAEFEAFGGPAALRDESHPGPAFTVRWVSGLVQMFARRPRAEWPRVPSEVCRSR
jgi:hypothetical protein